MSCTDRERGAELVDRLSGSHQFLTRQPATHVIEVTAETAIARGTVPIPDDLQTHLRRLCDLGRMPGVTVAWHGEPAAEKVVARAARLMKAHRVAFTILAAVHAGNADRPLDVYRFLRDEVGARFIHLIPVVDHLARPVNAEQWGSFLIRTFDEWARCDVGTVFVRVFDDLLLSWRGRQAPRNAGRDAGDLNDGYHALVDHATERWSQYAVSRL